MNSTSGRGKAVHCTVGIKKVHELDNLTFSQRIRKRQRRHRPTLILFLIPWFFSVKYQGIQEQYYSQSVSPHVSFFPVVPAGYIRMHQLFFPA